MRLVAAIARTICELLVPDSVCDNILHGAHSGMRGNPVAIEPRAFYLSNLNVEIGGRQNSEGPEGLGVWIDMGVRRVIVKKDGMASMGASQCCFRQLRPSLSRSKRRIGDAHAFVVNFNSVHRRCIFAIYCKTSA